MRKKSTSYYMGTLAIIALSFMILFREGPSFDHSDNHESEKSIGLINHEVNIDQLKNFLPDLNGNKSILPIIFLSTDMCPPCINNIVEYESSIKSMNEFSDPKILFLDQDEEHIERFMSITKVDIPYDIIDSSKLKLPYNEISLMKNILFIDLKSSVAFYNLVVPNYMIPMDAKEALVKEVEDEWLRLFADK